MRLLAERNGIYTPLRYLAVVDEAIEGINKEHIMEGIVKAPLMDQIFKHMSVETPVRDWPPADC